jgi:hypothetical protein
MADTATLKELLRVARNSRPFAGMKEEDVWQACLAYGDKSDTEVRAAMERIRRADRRMAGEEQSRKEALLSSREKMRTVRAEEGLDRQSEEKKAEQLLGQLFLRPKRTLWRRFVDFLKKIFNFLTK